MPARGIPRRGVRGTDRSANYSELIRGRLARDGFWSYTTIDDRWICPYCLTAVRAGSSKGHGGSSTKFKAIEKHLSQRCSGFQGGNGQYQPAEAIALQQQFENIAYQATTDPAWQVFDHEGYWYSPSSLKKVESVRIQNRRFDSFTVRKIAEHLTACPLYGQGRLHPPEEVQKARDIGMRVDKLAGDIEKLLGHSIWRYRDKENNWVCPYCLSHDTGVVVDDSSSWVEATTAMAAHLLLDCPDFSPTKQQMRTEAEVRAAAAAAPPSRIVTKKPDYTRTRSNATPIATPIQSPPSLDGSIPVARPVDPSTLDNPNPPATAMPASKDVPVAEAVDDSEAVVPIAAPANNDPVTTALRAAGINTDSIKKEEEATRIPSDEIDARLFGDIGDDPLAGSFLDEEPHAEEPLIDEADIIEVDSETLIKEPGSEAFADMIDGALDDNSGDFSVGSDALNWMDDISESDDEDEISSKHKTVREDNSELIRARDVQINLLRQAPEIPGFQFGSRFESCSEVSGDFYEYIDLPDGRIGFAQGDVSGHGMQAGLIMSMAKKVLSIYAKTEMSPAKVLSQVNDALVEDLKGQMFVSMTYAVLDPVHRSIIWARAGHSPTIKYNLHTKEITEINPPGMVVGMKGGPLFAKVTKEEEVKITTGDLFLIYTDGVTETMNRQGEEYGTELLNDLIVQHAGDDLESLLDRILDSVRGFRGGGEPQDDITLLALLAD